MALLSLCPGCLALAGDLILPGQSLILVASTSPALCSLQTQNSALQGALKSKGYQGLQLQVHGRGNPYSPSSLSFHADWDSKTHTHLSYWRVRGAFQLQQQSLI